MLITSIFLSLLLFSDASMAANQSCPGDHGPAKRFINCSDASGKVKESFKAVKPLCVEGWSLDSCITVFHVGNGKFVTNQHAWEMFMDIFRHQKKELGRKPKLTSVNSNGAQIDVSPSPIARGWWDKDISGKNKDHSKDLIVLNIPELIDEHKIEVGKPESCSSNVWVTGYPQGRNIFDKYPMNKPVCSQGQLNQLGEKNHVGDFLGVNGMSGTPVVNDQGKVCGVFWGKEDTFREKISIFLKTREAHNKLLACAPKEQSWVIPTKFLIQKINVANDKMKSSSKSAQESTLVAE